MKNIIKSHFISHPFHLLSPLYLLFRFKNFKIKSKISDKTTNLINGLPPHKKPNKFLLFIKKLLNRIFTRKFWYSSIIICSTGLFARYLIKKYLDVNVFIDYLDIISLCYYAFMAIYIPVIREIIAQLLDSNITMTNNQAGDRSSSSGGQENPTADSQENPMNRGGDNPTAAGQENPTAAGQGGGGSGQSRPQPKSLVSIESPLNPQPNTEPQTKTERPNNNKGEEEIVNKIIKLEIEQKLRDQKVYDSLEQGGEERQSLLNPQPNTESQTNTERPNNNKGEEETVNKIRKLE